LSGINCETDKEKIKTFFRRKSLTFGWIEDIIGVDQESLEATPSYDESERGERAYFLHPRYQTVNDFISNLEETKIINFQFQRRRFDRESYLKETTTECFSTLNQT
jgi:hypothetical protein